MGQNDYVTTGVRLPVTLYRVLKQQARQEGVSMAHIIRQSLQAYILWQSPPKPALGERESDSFFLIGSDPGHSGLGNGSINHDKYLYSA